MSQITTAAKGAATGVRCESPPLAADPFAAVGGGSGVRGQGSGVRGQRVRGASLVVSDGELAGIAALTPREAEIFRLLGAGLRIREIAGALGNSKKTIETHREHIGAKLGAAAGAMSLTQIALLAQRARFLGCDEPEDADVLLARRAGGGA